jgi:hypothetical protein
MSNTIPLDSIKDLTIKYGFPVRIKSVGGGRELDREVIPLEQLGFTLERIERLSEKESLYAMVNCATNQLAIVARIY